jgi:hypothetical protein
LEWVEWAEPLAYGALALKPWEFSNLQPDEFIMMLQGCFWRKEQQENLFAYFTCGLMNLFGKSLVAPISPKDLLEPIRNTKAARKATDEEYLREQFKHVLDREGGKN